MGFGGGSGPFAALLLRVGPGLFLGFKCSGIGFLFRHLAQRSYVAMGRRKAAGWDRRGGGHRSAGYRFAIGRWLGHTPEPGSAPAVVRTARERLGRCRSGMGKGTTTAAAAAGGKLAAMRRTGRHSWLLGVPE